MLLSSRTGKREMALAPIIRAVTGRDIMRQAAVSAVIESFRPQPERAESTTRGGSLGFQDVWMSTRELRRR